ncbi:intradiol ring-cleavage dioxygenase [Bremerella cremea]|uniref:Intradiol ring-cleavage dioxygenase n=1 Tax=Blastopirellula marina TaxID=124 RepID=A0A2S8FB79_9BACT|nr:MULTISPECIES: protocatechuate 3,4-dioxygenase [Pirellulaceae]PQO29426.1 intradiol ring-cleavage dioxygenase [Blastopirellula marina]RCS42730.1 intradiol ring-cleavage dioxygenase [Bremerella cremea]
MSCSSLFASRRQILRGAAAMGATALFTPGVFAEMLSLTPRLTEGPFYPDKLPLDQDNDLLIINDSTTRAIGEITHLTGKILSPSGAPLKNATIEIWQCDANAVYLHTRDSNGKKDQQDKNFQGYGKFETDSSGEYRFRTIKPVPYPGRPAGHIHFKVSQGDRELLTSQIFIRGFKGNDTDGVFRSTGDLVDRELVQTDFNPVKGSMIGELAANFDIVVGRTPDERQFESRR